MKRSTKMILFIAVAAVTFGSLNRLIGRGPCGGGFKHHNGCERPWQDGRAGSKLPSQGI